MARTQAIATEWSVDLNDITEVDSDVEMSDYVPLSSRKVSNLYL
jgi:hypothetical protein